MPLSGGAALLLSNSAFLTPRHQIIDHVRAQDPGSPAVFECCCLIRYSWPLFTLTTQSLLIVLLHAALPQDA